MIHSERHAHAYVMRFFLNENAFGLTNYFEMIEYFLGEKYIIQMACDAISVTACDSEISYFMPNELYNVIFFFWKNFLVILQSVNGGFVIY